VLCRAADIAFEAENGGHEIAESDRGLCPYSTPAAQPAIAYRMLEVQADADAVCA
jgi:hypothetical protein